MPNLSARMPVGGSLGRRSKFFHQTEFLDGPDELGRIVARTGEVWTLARGGPAGSATVVDGAGKVVVMAAHQPRYHCRYNPASGLFEPVGLLLEGSRTNDCRASGAMADGTYWSTSNASLTAAAGTAPDGTNTAVRLTATADNGFMYQETLRAAANGTANAGAVWVKAVSGTVAGLLRVNRAGGFDNADQAFTATTTWTRISDNHSTTWTGTTNTQLVVRVNTNGESILVWSGQLGVGAVPSSDIPTTTAAVTRAADALNAAFVVTPAQIMAAGGLTGYIKFTELGTILGGANQRVLQLGGNSGQRIIVFQESGPKYAIAHFNASTGVQQTLTSSTAPSVGDTVELRFFIGADGSVKMGQTVNVGAEVTQGPSGALTPESAFSALFAYVGGGNATAQGLLAVSALRFSLGTEKTLAYMRQG